MGEIRTSRIVSFSWRNFFPFLLDVVGQFELRYIFCRTNCCGCDSLCACVNDCVSDCVRMLVCQTPLINGNIISKLEKTNMNPWCRCFENNFATEICFCFSCRNDCFVAFFRFFFNSFSVCFCLTFAVRSIWRAFQRRIRVHFSWKPMEKIRFLATSTICWPMA